MTVARSVWRIRRAVLHNSAVPPKPSFHLRRWSRRTTGSTTQDGGTHVDIETLLEHYPKTVDLNGAKVVLRPLQPADVKAFHAFFRAAPETGRIFLKHRVTR